MTLITKTFTFTAGAAILSAEHNVNTNTIYDDYNGNITDINIKSDAAIADTKLAQITTANKLGGAALTSILEAVYPVGSIYYNASVSTNPSTLLGFGTWIIFGAGKVLVSQDTGDPDFDVIEEFGGSKTIDISHKHDLPIADTSSSLAWNTTPPFGTGANISTTHTGFNGANVFSLPAWKSDTFGSATQTIVQPYIVVAAWKRTV